MLVFHCHYARNSSVTSHKEAKVTLGCDKLIFKLSRNVPLQHGEWFCLLVEWDWESFIAFPHVFLEFSVS